MPTVDELLGDATGIEPAYLNDDIQYVIDENLRTVTIPEDGVVLGVRGDKDTNRVNFQMMRYYNGFDLSEFKFRVNYENANGGLNFYEVTDSTVYEDVIYFTWLVDAFAAAYVGVVNFSVRLYKTEGTKVTQNFYTTHNSATVLEGVLADEELDENNIEDLIEHLKRVIEEYGYEIAGPLLVSYLLDHNLGTEVTEEMVRRLLNTEYFSKMAFVKHTGANEFEYNESALEAKIRAYINININSIDTGVLTTERSIGAYQTRVVKEIPYPNGFTKENTYIYAELTRTVSQANASKINERPWYTFYDANDDIRNDENSSYIKFDLDDDNIKFRAVFTTKNGTSDSDYKDLAIQAKALIAKV